MALSHNDYPQEPETSLREWERILDWNENMYGWIGKMTHALAPVDE
jgi:hypothetical protein